MRITPLSREQAEQLVQRQSGAVYRLAYAQTGSRADADDVFQEVFLRYLKKRPVFESEEHEKAWFIRVTLNCCKKLWAAPWRRHDVPLDETLSTELSESQYLAEELKKLPPKYSAVLHLFYWEDMTVEEIGRLLDMKPNTVKSRLFRGRELLRARLKGDEDHVETRL